MANNGASAAPGTTALEDLIPGYPKLGWRMGLVPEMGIFRRFATLNAQMLLYMQSELIHLESELRKQELEDSKSSQPYESKYSRDCFFLHNPSKEVDDKQLRLVTDIKAKLKDYSKQAAAAFNSRLFTEATGIRQSFENAEVTDQHAGAFSV
jgi:hypothetical protein